MMTVASGTSINLQVRSMNQRMNNAIGIQMPSIVAMSISTAFVDGPRKAGAPNSVTSCLPPAGAMPSIADISVVA